MKWEIRDVKDNLVSRFEIAEEAIVNAKLLRMEKGKTYKVVEIATGEVLMVIE
jgi:hypothetical protein